MKLISLNAWGGRLKERFEGFFEKYPNIDFWLFQEVHNSTKEEEFVPVAGYNQPDFSLNDRFSKHLKSHRNSFCTTFRGTYGISTFFKNDIEIIGSGEIFLAKGDWYGGDYDGQGDHHRKMLWIEAKQGDKKFLVLNVHLTHRPEGKRDTPKRLLQSQLIVQFMNMFDCPKILTGDFNLLPDTESIHILEKVGMRNLIKEFGIVSTRTEIYKKEHRFADYVFVSEHVHVKDFKVLPDVVSDHSPLYLEFEI
ncbi:MAG: hypothetical protein RIT04_558 [Candidatus Parcubacteria bacterium]|jgi:exonuclease III